MEWRLIDVLKAARKASPAEALRDVVRGTIAGDIALVRRGILQTVCMIRLPFSSFAVETRVVVILSLQVPPPLGALTYLAVHVAHSYLPLINV